MSEVYYFLVTLKLIFCYFRDGRKRDRGLGLNVLCFKEFLLNYAISSRFGKAPCLSDPFFMFISIGSNSSRQVLCMLCQHIIVPHDFLDLGCL